MHLTAPEEYGLRCMLQLARQSEGRGLTISQIAEREGLSVANAGKLMAVLKRAGLVLSVRGRQGGYSLSQPPQRISVEAVLAAMGGELYGSDFCSHYRGEGASCVHSTDCSLRSMWALLDRVIRQVLARTTLKDLICCESSMATWLSGRVGEPVQLVTSIAGIGKEV